MLNCQKSKQIKEFCLVLSLALIANGASLFGDFIFDDTEAIVNNKDVLPQTPWINILKNDFWGTPLNHSLSHKSYRPLTTLTYRWNLILAGNTFTPWTFHLVNLVLHLINICLTLVAFRRILGEASYVKAACLFAVHPVHTEAVCAIVGRADLLASIFFILSFLCYSNKHHVNPGIHVILSIVLAGIAMFCKEYGLTVLAFNFIYEIVVYQKCNILPKYSSGLRHCVYLVTGTLCLLYLRGFLMDFKNPVFQPHDNPASFQENVFFRIMSLAYICSLNMCILFFPHWLCYDWSMGCIALIDNPTDPRIFYTIVFWTIFCSLIGKTLLNKKLNRAIILSFSLLIIPFLPASNLFFRVGFVIAERILYLPSMGFCLQVAVGFDRIAFLTRKNLNFIFSVVICVFLLKSHLRSLEWRSEFTLFNSALNICPNNAKVHYNIAKNAADRGKNSLAVAEYQEAIRLYPRYDQALNNLANLLKSEGDLQEAEKLLRKAIKIRFDFPAAWMNLGIVLSNLKNYNEAEKCYHMALKLRKNYPDCYYNLGNLYLEEKRWDEAESAWQAATRLRPGMTVAWTNLIALNDNLGRHRRAVELGQQALLDHNLTKEPPKNTMLGPIYHAMASAMAKLGDFHLAEDHFKMAITMDANNALYRLNLGVLYHRAKNYLRAEECYLEALKINPQLVSAKKNFDMLIQQKNRSS